VPLQQVVAAMLAEAGQYIRRERSFAGVEFGRDGRHRPGRADKVSEVFRAIRAFDVLKAEGRRSGVRRRRRRRGTRSLADSFDGRSGVTSTNFSSIMWNLVDQMLFTLKVDSRGRGGDRFDQGGRAGCHRRRQHDGGDAQPARRGDRISSMATRSTWISGRIAPLPRALARGHRQAAGRQKGDSYRHYLTDKELGPEGLASYVRRARSIIEESKIDLPASPIDMLIKKLRAAGVKVGRNHRTAERHRLPRRRNPTL
jgi:hypothetical protein